MYNKGNLLRLAYGWWWVIYSENRNRGITAVWKTNDVRLESNTERRRKKHNNGRPLRLSKILSRKSYIKMVHGACIRLRDLKAKNKKKKGKVKKTAFMYGPHLCGPCGVKFQALPPPPLPTNLQILEPRHGVSLSPMLTRALS